MKVVNAPELIINYEGVTVAITLTTWNSAACFHGAVTRKHDSWMIGGANLFFSPKRAVIKDACCSYWFPTVNARKIATRLCANHKNNAMAVQGRVGMQHCFYVKKKVLDLENCSGKRQGPILVQNVNFGGIPGNGSQPLFPI